MPSQYEEVDLNTLSATLPCLTECFKIDELGIPGGFDAFELKIDSAGTSIYGSFKNSNCGCDDITFSTPHLCVYRQPGTNNILIRILRWDPETQSYSVIQIEGTLDENCNITSAKSFFGNFPGFKKNRK